MSKLRGREWLVGDDLTIADFSIGAWIPIAERLQLPVAKFPEIARWHDKPDALYRSEIQAFINGHC